MRIARFLPDLLSLRDSMDEMWGAVRHFQAALDQLQGRLRAAPQEVIVLSRSMARDPAHESAVRAFVCEFYELQVAVDTAKAGIQPGPGLAELRLRFRRLGAWLHGLQRRPGTLPSGQRPIAGVSQQDGRLLAV